MSIGTEVKEVHGFFVILLDSNLGLLLGVQFSSVLIQELL
jgi:hypothetical protein